MKSEMSGKVIVITGASRSLGLQFAKEFAQRGARLGLIDLPGQPWEGIAEELKKAGAVDVAIESADVTIAEDIHRAIESAKSKLGPIDVLISNAGIGLDTPVDPFSLESVHKQIQVNYLGVANSIAAVLPGMVARKSGHLVTTGSISSYRGLPGMAGYCASKSAVVVMMDSLRVDLKPYGIKCTTLNPGWIRTGVIHTINAAKPGVTELPVAASIMAKAIVRQKPYVCFPLWLRTLFILNRLQTTNMGDWMLRKMWKWFGG